jgi:putative hydrolase of HD superfamily
MWGNLQEYKENWGKPKHFENPCQMGLFGGRLSDTNPSRTLAPMFPRRDIEFLFEIGSLRNMERGWRQHLATNVANDLEHTIRVCWLALMLARKEGNCDEALVLRMALAHDICETRISDLSYIQKVYVTADEERAVHDIFEGTSIADFEEDVKAFESRSTLEAKIVKDADNLDIDLELLELKEKGHELPYKWAQFRRKIREEKLYTQAARDFWDELQTADPADWHLSSNKWLKIPGAGK